jgi:hypothetical protein
VTIIDDLLVTPRMGGGKERALVEGASFRQIKRSKGVRLLTMTKGALPR